MRNFTGLFHRSDVQARSNRSQSSLKLNLDELSVKTTFLGPKTHYERNCTRYDALGTFI